MAENHRGGIAHLRGSQIFVAVKCEVVRAEGVSKDIHGHGCTCGLGRMPVFASAESDRPRCLPVRAEPCPKIVRDTDNAALAGLCLCTFDNDFVFGNFVPVEGKEFCRPWDRRKPWWRFLAGWQPGISAGELTPETTLDPWLDDPFPDYDTEPVMAFCATLKRLAATVFDFWARFCHSAPMETHAFGFRLLATTPGGPKAISYPYQFLSVTTS
jgi:hypothetical protein